MAGGRGGRGGDRDGRKSGNPIARETQISKALSRLLRHQAESAGIKLDREGFAALDKVLAWSSLRTLSPTVKEIQAVTKDNAKQRFTMRHISQTSSSSATPSTEEIQDTDPSNWFIRANQGHSIKLDSAALLKPITIELDNLPAIVVHGTYFAFWPKIVESGGLKSMGRNHVHCSSGLPSTTTTSKSDDKAAVVPAPDGEAAVPVVDTETANAETTEGTSTAVISGMRNDAELLIYIDVRQSLLDGAMTWWKSDNGVLLTEGTEDEKMVPLRYFKEVIGRKPEVVGVLWKDGEKVADLPAGVKSRPPQTKVSSGGHSGSSNDRGKARGGKLGDRR